MSLCSGTKVQIETPLLYDNETIKSIPHDSNIELNEESANDKQHIYKKMVYL